MSVDLARAFAQRVGVSLEPVVFDAAGKSAGAVMQEQADARRLGGLHLLCGRFMCIQRAMGTPKGRGAATATFLAQLVEEMKVVGFVADALARHGIEGSSFAPPTCN